jgi:trans-aconitate methyltransferase
MMYLLSLLKTKVYYVFYKLILSRLGYGNRIEKGVWDKEYEQNSWEYLSSADERGHYDVIIDFVNNSTTQPEILDIGCGHGVLYAYFKNILKPGFKYKGIDISQTAIKKAMTNHPSADFKAVDYDYHKIAPKFNVIVLNEVLYYFVKPIKTLLKAAKENLTDKGVLVISMYQDDKGKNNLIWKDVEENFKVIDSAVVQNNKGVKWTIKTITLVISNWLVYVATLAESFSIDFLEVMERSTSI